MEGRQLVGCLIYYVLFPYGGQREPFSSDVKQLAFKFRGSFASSLRIAARNRHSRMICMTLLPAWEISGPPAP